MSKKIKKRVKFYGGRLRPVRCIKVYSSLSSRSSLWPMLLLFWLLNFIYSLAAVMASEECSEEIMYQVVTTRALHST